MRPVSVVIVDVVGDEAFQLALVPDDGPVEELATQSSDPAFSERVGDWRSDRGFEDPQPFGSEDLVEAVDELAAAVTHERSATSAALQASLTSVIHSPTIVGSVPASSAWRYLDIHPSVFR